MTPDELENQMVASLEQLHRSYQQFETLVDELLVDSLPPSLLEQKMARLAQERQGLVQTLECNKRLREQYESTRPHASEAVTRLSRDTQQLIQALQMKISQLERQVQDAYDNLSPQIHQGVRAVQMKNAYQRN